MMNLETTSIITKKTVRTKPVCSSENPDHQERRGYKETECFWLDHNNMVMTNSDIPLDETMRFAIKLAMYFDRNNKINSLLKKFR